MTTIGDEEFLEKITIRQRKRALYGRRQLMNTE
jgi:hypothetical protein